MESRLEELLDAIINGTSYDIKPISRAEALLILLKEKIEAGSSSPEEIKKHINEYLDNHGSEFINIVVINDKDKITERTKMFFNTNGIQMESPDMEEFNKLASQTVGNATPTEEELDQIFKEV